MAAKDLPVVEVTAREADTATVWVLVKLDENRLPGHTDWAHPVVSRIVCDDCAHKFREKPTPAAGPAEGSYQIYGIDPDEICTGCGLTVTQGAAAYRERTKDWQ